MEPCNHNNIPHYQSINPLIKDTHRSDKPCINTVNVSLCKLTPKGKVIAKTIGIIALSLFPIIAALFLNSGVPLAAYTVVSVIASSVALQDYFKNRKELADLQKSIADIYTEYSKEFTFLRQKFEKILPVEPEDYERIKEYTSETNPLTYQIREEIHYQLEGGNIENWSITPLKLKEVCKTTNTNKVIENYRPWIQFLIDLTKDEDLPEAFLMLIGKMAGFKRTLLDVVIFEDENYTGIYKNKSIICTRKSDRSQIIIKTPEECRDFVIDALFPYLKKE